MRLLTTLAAAQGTIMGLGLGLAIGGALTVAAHGAMALDPKK